MFLEQQHQQQWDNESAARRDSHWHLSSVYLVIHPCEYFMGSILTLTVNFVCIRGWVCVYSMCACTWRHATLSSFSCPSSFLHFYFFSSTSFSPSLSRFLSVFPIKTNCQQIFKTNYTRNFHQLCLEKKTHGTVFWLISPSACVGIIESKSILPSWNWGCRVWLSPQTAICTVCLHRTARQAASQGMDTPWLLWVHLIGTELGQS